MSGDTAARAVPMSLAPAGEENPALKSASRLQAELGCAGIPATISSGFELALVLADQVNVWVEPGLDGWLFRWWTGRVSDQGLWQYTSCPASAVETAVRRVGTRVRQMRQADRAVPLGELDRSRTAAECGCGPESAKSVLGSDADGSFSSERRAS
ncbi:hypothetical protein ACQP1K_27225 [Sphaerimonospora sp. CA-214678]|uniref:hypothetical protein n=1 Tax=Sphaerimonospora sp. CA-214678 TaxID=3240029 RepID=UPI003D907271